MKILMINKYYQITGGADSDFFLTIQILEQAGHQVVPFCMDVQGNFTSLYEAYFVKSLTYRNWKQASLWLQGKTFFQSLYNMDAHRSITRLIQEFAPDVAHVHNILYQLSPSVLEPLWRRNIPIIQTLHDYHLICPGGFMYAQGNIQKDCKNQLGLFNCVAKRCHSNSRVVSVLAVTAHAFHRLTGIYEPRVSAFAAPSKFLYAKMVEHGVRPEKIFVIPQPLDTTEFIANYTPGDYAVFVGRIVDYKGYKTLVRAAAGLQMRVLIIGDGPKADVTQLQQLLKVENASNIQWLGPKPPTQVYEYIRGSSFVIVPSEWNENFPAVIREAFALGKPVVAARIGGIPELVDQETGILFEPRNVQHLRTALQELGSDQERVRMLGKNARRRAETVLSPIRYVNSLVDLYYVLLSAKPQALLRSTNAAT